MKYSGLYEAKMHGNWAVIHPKLPCWPSGTMWVTLCLSSAGTFIAGFEREPCLRACRAMMKREYANMLISHGEKPVDARKHADYYAKQVIRFSPVKVGGGRSVNLEGFIESAGLKPPFVWTGSPFSPPDSQGGIEGIEFWSRERYEKEMQAVEKELAATGNRRIGWVMQQ